MATSRKKQNRAGAMPARAHYWLIDPHSLADIANHAAVALEANPARDGAADWRQARTHAALAQSAVAAGDAEGAAWATLTALRHALRAELLEGPLPQIRELRERPSKHGKLAKGVPKEERKTPLRRGLEMLVGEGMENAEILEYLRNADAVSSRVVSSEFPFEVNETLEGEDVSWYPRGGNSDDAEKASPQAIGKILSRIRNPKKSH